MKAEENESRLKSAAEIAAERMTSEGDSGKSGEPLSNEIEALRTEAAKAKDYYDRLLRLQADMDNYRKRMTRERQDLLKSANEKLLLDLLTPIDHFEMGLQSVPKTTDKDPLREGMEMILAQFQQFLKSHHVTEVDAVGKPFDPALHEAVAHQESDEPEGQVIQQLRKGYRMEHKLLRPASVIVSKGKAGEEKKDE